MKPVLGMDIDGTIHNLYDLANKRASEITGVEIKTKDWGDDYYYLRNHFGDEVADDAFRYATDPQFYSERRLYPYVRDSLLEISEFTSIRFVTHNKDERRREPLKRWLSDIFPDLDFEFSLTTTWDKNHVLKRVGAWGIVDDRPATLADAGHIGLWPATKLQPWNRRVIGPHPEGFEIEAFNSWKDAPILVMGAMKRRGLLNAPQRVSYRKGRRVPIANV